MLQSHTVVILAFSLSSEDSRVKKAKHKNSEVKVLSLFSHSADPGVFIFYSVVGFKASEDLIQIIKPRLTKYTQLEECIIFPFFLSFVGKVPRKEGSRRRQVTVDRLFDVFSHVVHVSQIRWNMGRYHQNLKLNLLEYGHGRPFKIVSVAVSLSGVVLQNNEYQISAKFVILKDA